MKSSLLKKILSAVSISATLSLFSGLPVLAQVKDTTTLNRSITPFSLVSQAQEGRLQRQGIPGYGALATKYMLHQVTAESLVQAGIDAHLIPPQTLQDRGYINAVNSQLQQRIND
ncbi:MAG: hypothetical protein WA865_11030 [Spirulinaceae cyanobacterium]